MREEEKLCTNIFDLDSYENVLDVNLVGNPCERWWDTIATKHMCSR